MVKNLSPSQFSQGPRPDLVFLALYLAILPTVGQSATLGGATVLIYSATRGSGHDFIPTAIGALESRSAGYHITFEVTEDPTWFREDNLRGYDAVVFLIRQEMVSFSICVLSRLGDLIDVRYSPGHGGQDCLPELPEQRRKLRRNLLR